MQSLAEIVDELFSCLGPLKACEEPVQDRCVDPLQSYVIDPLQEKCIDPVARAMAVNPLGCLPLIGGEQPSLPQDDSAAQQDSREQQLQRARRDYQYNYDKVRTFHVVDGKGVQGEGIGILDSLPISQMPSLCWVCLLLQHVLVLIDNLLMIIELLLQQPRRQHVIDHIQSAKLKRDSLEEDAGITELTINDTTPEELQKRRDELLRFRDNIAGTFAWARRLAGSTLNTVSGNGPDDADAPLPPPSETAPTGCSPCPCPCPRCSPATFTREVVNDISADVQRIVKQFLAIPALDRHPLSLQAYNDLFQAIPLPKFAHTFQNDEMFALQRIAGQNPVVIRRAEWTDELALQFPVTNQQYQSVMGEDDNLALASAEARLYLCDYAQSLLNTIAGDFPPFCGQKYLNAPLALFALLKSDRKKIRAVAIQCGQEPGKQNPVITPSDEWSWAIAKTIVQSSDCNDSEYYRHLGLAHLLSEAFGVAIYRQLSREHPLYILLTPNFQGTFFTNNMAVNSILQEGSYFNITEMIFAGTVPSTLGIAANSVHDVDYTENMVPNELKSRGVEDPLIFPNYPYRDDALLIWRTIGRWAESYVRLYYTSDRDVIGDYELQNFVAEVSSHNGGRIQGIGPIETVDALIELMTAIIYTASAHHALTNFPLDDYEIYSPGWPGATYQPPPTSAKGATRKDWFQYLAPLDMALLQQALGFTVGSTYFTQLGCYPPCHFNDSRVRIPLMAYTEDLKRAEEIIRDRNSTRVLKYPYLLPSRIPQSTNI
jgi:arachidonate 15-lipoxygenase